MPKFRISEILLVLYVFFIPLESLIVFEYIGSFSRIIGYLLLITFLIEYRINFYLVSKEAYVFIAFLLLSSLWAKEVESIQYFRTFMFFLIMFIVIHVLKKNSKLLIILINSFCIASFLLAITSFAGFLRINDRFTSIEGMGEAPLSLYLAIALGFQFSAFELKRVTLYNTTMAVVLSLGIIATGTRASWLAAAAIFTVFIFRRANFSKFLKRIMVVLTIVLFLLTIFPSMTKFIDFRTNQLEYDKGANRTIIWAVGWEMWKDKPLFGFGYRNFPTSFTFEYIDRTEMSNADYSSLTHGGKNANRGSHSDYISIAVELGIAGLILFFLWLRHLLKNFKYISPYYFGFIAILIMSMFQDNINNKAFWFVFGIMEIYKATNVHVRRSLYIPPIHKPKSIKA